MSDDLNPDSEQSPDADDRRRDTAAQTQEVRQQHVSALVPEHVGRGVFSTGAVVLQGGHEFILDFLLRMTQPHQVAARIVLPPSVVPRMIAALRENLNNYQKRFGVLPAAPKGNANAPQPSAQEVYDHLKIPDDVISGRYANAVMIGHTGHEFSFDFITTFFPRSAVSCRVFLSAPNVPRLLDSLTQSFEQYRRRMAQQQQAAGAPSPNPGGEPA